MLATKNADEPFKEEKSYTKDLSDIGFQFERYVTGGSMMDTKDTRSVEHIHTMKVGNKIVFFRAEVDAVDENGAAIEIKASNPRSKMISSGSSSSKLCHGEKSRGTLTRVTLTSLTSVAVTALEYSSARALENNILDGMEMEAIYKQVKDEKRYRVCFTSPAVH
eukprot:scaffold2841_cov74-Cyclotella_meneghiniana.AAC.10